MNSTRILARSRVYALTGILTAVALVAILRSGVAFAHPLGNFTINHYSRIEIAQDGVRVRYVLDMAEIPTFQEMDRIDANRDGLADAGELSQYAKRKAAEVAKEALLTVDGERVALGVVDVTAGAELLPGQGGLQILRFTAWFEAALPGERLQHDITYEDGNYAGRLGWKEIVVRALDGVALTHSTAPDTDTSNELTAYPDSLLKSPLNVSKAEAAYRYAPIGGDARAPQGGAISGAGATSDTPVRKDNGGFSALTTHRELTLPVLFISLLAAMFWGAMHAMSPGHGKTIAAAYLVGSRGTPRHAAFLALIVTMTHTSAVFALGLITLFASHFIVIEDVFVWLELASGVMVISLGGFLLQSRLRRTRLWARLWEKAGALSLRHGYEDEHPRNHNHDHGTGQGCSHEGGPVAHTHLQTSKLSPRGLVALGISGGLLPCPSAIVVMLSAISLNRIGFGLVLIVAFSAGLALALAAAGLVVVYGGQVLSHLTRRRALGMAGFRVVAQVVPIGSAVFISVAGLVLTIRAVSQVG